MKLTSEHFGMIQDLKRCTFLPGSFDKRFVRNMSYHVEGSDITEKQAECLKKMHHRYRRQIGVKK